MTMYDDDLHLRRERRLNLRLPREWRWVVIGHIGHHVAVVVHGASFLLCTGKIIQKKSPRRKFGKGSFSYQIFYMCRKRTDSHRAMSRFACATDISSSSAIRSYVARSIRNRLTMRRLRSPRIQRSTPAATSAFERPSYRSLRRVILHTFRARLLRVCCPVAFAKPHGVGQNEQPRQERREK